MHADPKGVLTGVHFLDGDPDPGNLAHNEREIGSMVKHRVGGAGRLIAGH